MGAPRTGGSMGGGMLMAGAGGGAVVATGDRPGYGRSFAFGLLFAAGWSPCIGPILGGILGLASASASVAMGTALLVAYAAGLAVPFMAVALGSSAVATRLTFIGRHHVAVNAVTGMLLGVLGVLMLTNMLGQLAKLTSPLGL
jgi:cytochrome c-type biogenesis protein